MRTILLLVLCLSWSGFGACTESVIATAERRHELFREQLIPLAWGNWWEYRVQDVAQNSVYTHRQNLLFAGLNPDRQRSYDAEGQSWNRGFSGESFCIIDSDTLLGIDLSYGLHNGAGTLLAGFQPERHTATERYYWYSLASEAEAGASVHLRTEGLIRARCSWAAGDTSLTVPAGSYRCRRLDMRVYDAGQRPYAEVRRYFAAGIGIVLLEVSAISDSEIILRKRLELQRFRVH